MGVEADDEDEEGEDDEEQGLLEGESEEEESDALADILDMLGLGAIAEDAKWLNMTLHNSKKKRLEARGKIAVSISIVPWKEVEERPVGAAQDSPNANPFLPPPVGRMTFSLNPIAIFKELIGPETILVILCCCCCVLCFVALMFLGQYYVTAYTLLKSFGAR